MQWGNCERKTLARASRESSFRTRRSCRLEGVVQRRSSKIEGRPSPRFAVLGVGIARAHADRSVGHPGVFSRCQACLTGLARRLLALRTSALECEGLGQKPQSIRARPRGNEKVGRKSQNGPLRSISSRYGTDDPARSPAYCGSQRVSFGAGPHGSAYSRQLEIEFAPRKAFHAFTCFPPALHIFD
jgi:hypothetical protein